MKGSRKSNNIVYLGFKLINKKINIQKCMEFIDWCEKGSSLEYMNFLISLII